jgi:hypothetical protein
VQPDDPGLAASEPRSDLLPREVLVVAKPSYLLGGTRGRGLDRVVEDLTGDEETQTVINE